ICAAPALQFLANSDVEKPGVSFFCGEIKGPPEGETWVGNLGMRNPNANRGFTSAFPLHFDCMKIERPGVRPSVFALSLGFLRSVGLSVSQLSLCRVLKVINPNGQVDLLV